MNRDDLKSILERHRRWLTHEFMALMLGVRRLGVTVAIGALQKAGLIRHGNGYVDIIDREGLEGRARECYAAVRHRHETLLSF
jgi:hypothetical protein